MLKIYNEYSSLGVNNYYKLNNSSYYNPHQDKINKIFTEYIIPYIQSLGVISIKHYTPQIDHKFKILDLACGNGLVSRIINNIIPVNNNAKQSDNNFNINNNIKQSNNNKTKIKNIIIEGCDPYFHNEYVKYTYSFQDIANGVLYNTKLKFDLVTCCYAFHLLDTSWYYSFFEELALTTDNFIIITPSKKIEIKHPRWIIKNKIRKNKITIIFLVINFKQLNLNN